MFVSSEFLTVFLTVDASAVTGFTTIHTTRLLLLSFHPDSPVRGRRNQWYSIQRRLFRKSHRPGMLGCGTSDNPDRQRSVALIFVSKSHSPSTVRQSPQDDDDGDDGGVERNSPQSYRCLVVHQFTSVLEYDVKYLALLRLRAVFWRTEVESYTVAVIDELVLAQDSERSIKVRSINALERELSEQLSPNRRVIIRRVVLDELVDPLAHVR